MKRVLFLIILISAISFHADTKEKREKKYTFHPASIFEIPQNDPYKIHVGGDEWPSFDPYLHV